MLTWLCILTRNNFEIVKKKEVWGVSEPHKREIFKTRPGELCAFYLTAEGVGKNRKESAIGGIFEIYSKPYEDHSDIFQSKKTPNEKYPFRVKLKKINIFDPELPFRQMIPELSFIKNKTKYSGHLLGRAMRVIPEEDMKKIQQTDL